MVVGGAAPLLVHQTLANREQVLVCASCHRFVGAPATQLAMLEGFSRPPPSRAASNATRIKKRGRWGDAGLGPHSPPAVDAAASSRRVAVACAPPSRLPDLPTTAKRVEKEDQDEDQKDAGEGAGGIWKCKGGTPCDDMYCSAPCREAALVGGHGLICPGGSGPGRLVWLRSEWGRNAPCVLVARCRVVSYRTTFWPR